MNGEQTAIMALREPRGTMMAVSFPLLLVLKPTTALILNTYDSKLITYYSILTTLCLTPFIF
jgi:hypothetical protein